MDAFNKQWEPVRNIVVLTKLGVFSELLSDFTMDASDIKNWNDLIVGRVKEIGPGVDNVKVGDHIGVTLSMCLSMRDIAESEELIPNELDTFMIPAHFIKNTFKLNRIKKEN